MLKLTRPIFGQNKLLLSRFLTVNNTSHLISLEFSQSATQSQSISLDLQQSSTSISVSILHCHFSSIFIREELGETSVEVTLMRITELHVLARCRLPVILWCHPGSGDVIARSSQPLFGLMMNMRRYIKVIL
ncbi:uncharacterized protein LOC110229091 [Arabidopsis lyrata subsp. lyrata]|uniref:uncharacterized protein LOC110229091 n=1 Tax=Arabidopsis lyrata subsp. lyrata TaxID=81972 RepID=UPI000A29A5B1|nr:uncharacterized protein LOC110229091 [Arabidopsis lyrata subsp. lyrata]|eukprot:XP_020883627.1 uncharacterized protein LOC110229091 [Arabidopsis lyrata subsp. lyrata]